MEGNKVGVLPREGGTYSLFCYDCRRWIPGELTKKGVWEHGHHCTEIEGDRILILGEQGIPEGEESRNIA